MLSAKPWKPDAIIRLLLSVFVCIFIGSLLPSLWQRSGASGTVAGRLVVPLVMIAIGSLIGALVLISKPWPLEAFERRLGLVLLFLSVGFLAGALGQRLAGNRASEMSIERMILGTLSFQGAGLILITRFLHEQQLNWDEGFGLSNRRGRAVVLGVLIALIFLPVGWGLQQASANVMTHLPHLNLRPEEQPSVHALRVAASWGNRLALGAAAILLAPVAEEALFRGILYSAVKQAGFPRMALWGTSLLFALVHVNLVTFLPLVVLSLVLTALYERTNNLLAPITAHAMFNALNYVTLFVLQEKMGG
jgi:membrane protease YdiL (CAAX protease family)